RHGNAVWDQPQRGERLSTAISVKPKVAAFALRCLNPSSALVTSDVSKRKRTRSNPKVSQGDVDRTESHRPEIVHQTLPADRPRDIPASRFYSIVVAAVGLMTLLIYYDFFFGQKTLLFTEFGSDSI